MKYIVLFLLSSVAYAEDTEEEPKVVYKERTEIDFEGVEVQGELVKPQGSLLLERKHAKFNPMIKLRTDFDDEMDKSVDEIK
jgi:RNase P/RNase MRP subunit p29